MADAAPPLPFAKPPTIEESAQHHLDVVHELREMRADLDAMQDVQQATAKVATALAGDIGRLFDLRSADNLTLQRIERKLDRLIAAVMKEKP